MLDPKTETYIAKAPDFARPILRYFRTAVHQAGVSLTESIKWGVPSFEYQGKIICNMAAFKKHCAIGFWSGGHLKALEPYGHPDPDSRVAFWRLTDLTTVQQLPPSAQISAAVRQAVHLMESGVTAQRRHPGNGKASALPVPVALSEALGRHPKAQAVFEQFAASRRNEYIEWIAGAKAIATRDKRIATALEWIAAGKGRNWKYEKKKA